MSGEPPCASVAGVTSFLVSVATFSWTIWWLYPPHVHAGGVEGGSLHKQVANAGYEKLSREEIGERTAFQKITVLGSPEYVVTRAKNGQAPTNRHWPCACS